MHSNVTAHASSKGDGGRNVSVSQGRQERTSDALPGLSAFRMGSSALHFQSCIPKPVRRPAIIRVTSTTMATPKQLHTPSQSSSFLLALHLTQQASPIMSPGQARATAKVAIGPPVAPPCFREAKAHLLGTVWLGAITAGAISDNYGGPERSNEMRGTAGTCFIPSCGFAGAPLEHSSRCAHSRS